jgi:hypothetical protein
VERRRRLRGGRRRGISRPWFSPREKRAQKFHRSRASPRELRRRPNFSRASSGLAWPPKNETLARFARARGERAKRPAGGWLPTRGLVSITLKWPSWAWPAVRSPYQTHPQGPHPSSHPSTGPLFWGDVVDGRYSCHELVGDLLAIIGLRWNG